MKHTYLITGMTCTGCQQKVKGLLEATPGITNVTVDLANGTAEIEMTNHIATETLQASLKDYPKYQLTDTPKPVPVYEEPKASWLVTYKPILLIFGYVLGVSVLIGGRNIWEIMRVFMAGFFLVFSFFKMLDINGFADSYSMYDVIAKKVRGWGYVYPFVELGLGVAFLTGYKPIQANIITLVVMGISIVGVLQSVFNKRKIKCACLGAVFNLTMSTVTIIEDALMIGMSVIMLIKMY